MTQQQTSETDSPLYRAVVTWTDTDGELVIKKEGMYQKREAAQKRADNWVTHLRRVKGITAVGEIEEGTVTWHEPGVITYGFVNAWKVAALIDQWMYEAVLYGTATTQSGMPIPAQRRTGQILMACVEQLKAAVEHDIPSPIEDVSQAKEEIKKVLTYLTPSEEADYAMKTPEQQEEHIMHALRKLTAFVSDE